MSLRTLLLERLKQKSNAEFEEILFRLEGIYHGLHSQISASGPLSERAMPLIRFLEQDPAGLGHLGKQLGEPFTVPCAAIVELENLLPQAEIAEPKMCQVLGDYLKTLGEQVLWNSPDLAAQPLWDELLSYLADPTWMRSANKPHLLHFIQRLAPYAKHPFHRNALQQWVGNTAAGLGVPPPRTQSAHRRRAEITQSYLSLAIASQGDFFILHAWFMDSAGNCSKIYERKLGATLDSIAGHLKTVLMDRMVSKACREGNPPVLEFFLSNDLLLNHDPAQWKLPPEDIEPLSMHFGLVLRSGKRLWDTPSQPRWGSYWNQHRHTLTQRADKRRTAWLTCADGYYDDHLKAGRWVFGLGFVPDATCLELLLESGVGILLWPRHPVDEIELDQLKADLAKQKIGHLPLWLMEKRKRCWRETKTTGLFSLLWDDPTRSPDYYAPAEPHADYAG